MTNRTAQARCPDCLGHGVIYLHREGYDGEHPEQAEYTCAMCRGTGWVPPLDHTLVALAVAFPDVARALAPEGIA